MQKHHPHLHLHVHMAFSLWVPVPKFPLFIRTHRKGGGASLVVKNLPANAGDTGSIPDPGRFHMLRSN